MKPNVGNVDRLVRVILGALLVLAWMLGWMSGIIAIVLGIVGIVLVMTSLMSICPLYSLLGIRTRKIA